MAKQVKKAGARSGRKKVQVKELSKPQENVTAKRMKNIKGGATSQQDITITKPVDKSSSK